MSQRRAHRLNRQWLAWWMVALLCAACGQSSVDLRAEASDYDAFWLWGGVKPQVVLNTAKTLYVLQGDVSAPLSASRSASRSEPKNPQLVFQGMGVPHSRLPMPVWLVFRAKNLDFSPATIADIIGRLDAWRNAGNRVVGVQIDFDAGTRQLSQYAQFLTEFRQKLPRDYALSATGLLDWAQNARIYDINALAGVIDELVIQTYQGKQTVPHYDAYLRRLSQIEIPFKIGLVQNGLWVAPSNLPRHPQFRGYVVFLVNP